MSDRMRGRVTIPTDVDVVKETLELVKRWGADAIRDCDGTEYPEELKNVDAKVYSTYYTTRKDNEWAKAHPEEIQQMYIMTPFYNAVDENLRIHLMDHLYPDMLAVNTMTLQDGGRSLTGLPGKRCRPRERAAAHGRERSALVKSGIMKKRPATW